jgi:hypothetical protein
VLEIILPGGVTIAATGADVAVALATVVAPSNLPAPSVPAQPAQVAPTQERTQDAPATPARKRAPKAAPKAAAAKAAPSDRKAANKLAQAEITRLRKAGDHDAADAIARERGWSVPARASVPVPVSEPAPVVEPAPAPPKAAATTEASKPAPKAKAKRDRSAGGTKRTNGHKLTCACGMCVKLFGAQPAPAVSTHELAMQPPSDSKARQVKSADKVSATSTKRGPIPTHTETPVAQVLAQSERDEKRDALRRHAVLDACTDVRDDVREQVTKAMRAGDEDALMALVSDLDAQRTDQGKAMAKCAEASDGLGMWEARELTKALDAAHTYVMNTLDEITEPV